MRSTLLQIILFSVVKSYFHADYRSNHYAKINLIIVLPNFRSTPDLVIGMGV